MSESGHDAGTLRLSANAEVFGEIYLRARQFAAFIASADVEPDDLLQDALERVLRHTDLGLLGNPLAYLRTTMLNIVRNEHRRLGRESAAFTRVAAPGVVDDAAERVIDVAVALQALSGLPVRSRALVFLVDIEDQPIDAAASIVGVTASAARARLSRARRALREQLEAMEAPE